MAPRRFLASGLVILGLGCSNGSSRDAVPFSEHRPSKALNEGALHLGEDCGAGGSTACLSHLCGHFAATPESGYFCTRTCSVLSDCPRDWACS